MMPDDGSMMGGDTAMRTSPVRLTKHHAAGNDFLVLLDLEDGTPLDSERVRFLCDRHRGIGADGVIRVLRAGSGSRLRMELTNADGSPAEMSGNGIRCLVQAAVGAGIAEAGRIEVETVAGLRAVEYTEVDEIRGFGTVDMGKVRLGERWRPGDERSLAAGLDGLPGSMDMIEAREASMGNPHLVLLASAAPASGVLDRYGPLLEKSVSGGTNVEIVWPLHEGALGMVVWERGVGATLACGTGSCAAAAVARQAGICADRVRVMNPGGELQVTMLRDRVQLGGPTVKVAEVTAFLAAAHDSAAYDPAVRGTAADDDDSSSRNQVITQ
jgi:diaminopimelate epimerase